VTRRSLRESNWIFMILGFFGSGRKISGRKIRKRESECGHVCGGFVSGWVFCRSTGDHFERVLKVTVLRPLFTHWMWFSDVWRKRRRISFSERGRTTSKPVILNAVSGDKRRKRCVPIILPSAITSIRFTTCASPPRKCVTASL